jgi:SAM-dependent methyltransferase
MSSSWLRKNWAKIGVEYGQSPVRLYLSPALYAQYRGLVPLMRLHVHGKLIDLGCGLMPFRPELEDSVTSYDSLDLWPSTDGISFVADICDMSMVPSGVYDSAICVEVLEHVPNPCAAVREIRRILKPGGMLVLSVPHLSRLHNEPHDYFRYTVHGLRRLLEDGGFEVLEIRRRGGLFSFLGHQASSVFLSATWALPWMRRPAFFVNKWCVTKMCSGLDQLTDRVGVFALGYVAAARCSASGPVSRAYQVPGEQG